MTHDELPYTCSAMPYAHPQHLATIATLFGMKPPPPSTARILELGCCDGSHLVAIAHTLPQAHCWGVDLSATNIAHAQTMVEHLGLTQVTLKAMDILDIDTNFGQFDYIIAHGIYSWVTPAVQQKILQLCQQLLTPDGVAYISYNTQPGWQFRQTLRDMMHYHTSHFPNTTAPDEPLKKLLDFFTQATAQAKEPYSQFAHQEINQCRQLPESFLYDTFWQENPQPEYFYQFIEKARQHGLEYLSDAFVHTMLIDTFPPAVAQGLQMFKHDLIHQEQMMDFLRHRHFRHTLLCHQNQSLTRTLSADSLQHFFISAFLQPVPDTAGQQFGNRKGRVSTDNPLIKKTFTYLNQQWPCAVALDELFTTVTDETHQTIDQAEQATIKDTLLKCYTMGLIEFQLTPSQFTTTVSEKPQASPLARWQVQQGLPQVTNQRCEVVKIENQIALRFLPYLDGHHDHQALLNLLTQWVTEGLVKINVTHQETGEPITLSEAHRQTIIKNVLEEVLTLTARAALLIA
jgi:methyltransferase-like protein/SAM-dependent methyltransferase